MADLFDKKPTKKINLSQPVAVKRDHLEKSCAVCGKSNVGFGFGVSLRHNEKGLWSCFNHRTEVEAMLKGKS